MNKSASTGTSIMHIVDDLDGSGSVFPALQSHISSDDTTSKKRQLKHRSTSNHTTRSIPALRHRAKPSVWEIEQSKLFESSVKQASRPSAGESVGLCAANVTARLDHPLAVHFATRAEKERDIGLASAVAAAEGKKTEVNTHQAKIKAAQRVVKTLRKMLTNERNEMIEAAKQQRLEKLLNSKPDGSQQHDSSEVLGGISLTSINQKRKQRQKMNRSQHEFSLIREVEAPTVAVGDVQLPITNHKQIDASVLQQWKDELITQPKPSIEPTVAISSFHSSWTAQSPSNTLEQSSSFSHNSHASQPCISVEKLREQVRLRGEYGDEVIREVTAAWDHHRNKSLRLRYPAKKDEDEIEFLASVYAESMEMNGERSLDDMQKQAAAMQPAFVSRQRNEYPMRYPPALIEFYRRYHGQEKAPELHTLPTNSFAAPLHKRVRNAKAVPFEFNNSSLLQGRPIDVDATKKSKRAPPPSDTNALTSSIAAEKDVNDIETIIGSSMGTTVKGGIRIGAKPPQRVKRATVSANDGDMVRDSDETTVDISNEMKLSLRHRMNVELGSGLWDDSIASGIAEPLDSLAYCVYSGNAADSVKQGSALRLRASAVPSMGTGSAAMRHMSDTATVASLNSEQWNYDTLRQKENGVYSNDFPSFASSSHFPYSFEAHQAATRIQRAWRGRMLYVFNSAAHLQRIYRGWKTRRRYFMLRQQCHAAALRIQSVSRGYLVRRALAYSKWLRMTAAAIAMQALWRGYKGRKRFARFYKRHIHRKCRHIQRIWRGYWTRRQVEWLRFVRTTQHHQRLLIATIHAQRLARGRAARSLCNYMRWNIKTIECWWAYHVGFRHRGATALQSLWRGYRFRTQLHSQMALRIQTCVRGFVTRRWFARQLQRLEELREQHAAEREAAGIEAGNRMVAATIAWFSTDQGKSALKQEIEAIKAERKAREVAAKLGRITESQKREAEIKEIFYAYDADASGAIDVSEFKHILTDLCVALDAQQMEEEFQMIDRDHSGAIDFTEFSAWYFQQDQSAQPANSANMLRMKLRGFRFVKDLFGKTDKQIARYRLLSQRKARAVEDGQARYFRRNVASAFKVEDFAARPLTSIAWTKPTASSHRNRLRSASTEDLEEVF